MTPAARLAAAASVLDSIAQGRQPAEAVLKAWGTENRYAGSKDRRAVADRVYRVLRARGRLVWAMGGREDGRALVIGSLSLIDGLSLEEIEALHMGDGYGPKPLSKQERSRLTATTDELPGWVAAGLPEFVMEDFKSTYGDGWAEEAKALMVPRAPIDLRVNAAKATVADVEAELRAAGLEPQRTPWSAWGLRLSAEPPPNVQALEAFKAGRIEIQDEGSQIICWLAGVEPGMTVVDYCAGGGGKTLGLAMQMRAATGLQPTAPEEPAKVWTPTGWVEAPKGKAATVVRTDGKLVAYDVVQKRLDNIKPRLQRAGVAAELHQLGPNGGGVEDMVGQADVVLVDAPCTGSGTWRRRPEDAWRLTPEDVDRMQGLQTAIVARAAKLLKPGGRLVYATCSMLTAENEVSVAAFEEDHPGFRPVAIAEALNNANFTEAGREKLAELATGGHRLRLSPATAGTDGFFAAVYEKAQ
ncbi:RsmB/NOP family class I SAM-dependent RNA methyltransferase [Brevundimonas goettingensis]|uniref:RsmB/NOP family class I SAM-dependent RNA methyltransferase n=1 Tax=Brevundimonas goettingensis TaxID=2774190 RepID=A0A975GWR5_9CAUL|nr:RsmB/NOP family class I SAM-dependent RNA methyltransferase [Brevundimonas goettingensis]QTC92094.1 RsmB/NOP family class I SAM-dependent RNA methyltransferase [Brevundimonas goettingensis]